MRAVKSFAADGGMVIGICNGFQILCESGLLPGALVRNRGLHFICEHIHVRVERHNSPFTNATWNGAVLRLPIAHGEGCYFAEDAFSTISSVKVACYSVTAMRAGARPRRPIRTARRTISLEFCNEARNVCGLMPHPERACDPLLGSTDGLLIFQSMLEWPASPLRQVA